MGAKAIVALTDSRLAANQINREYEVKDKRMEKYVKAMQWLVKLLKEFTIEHIPRGETEEWMPSAR